MYIIDFGFSKVHSTFPNKTNGLIGSNNYASLSAHKCIEISRRDDIESTCYMLMYFSKGYLPWNSMTDQIQIIEAKERMWEEYPSVINDILKYVKQIEFNETPNYYFIIHKFKEYLKTILVV